MKAFMCSNQKAIVVGTSFVLIIRQIVALKPTSLNTKMCDATSSKLERNTSELTYKFLPHQLMETSNWN